MQYLFVTETPAFANSKITIIDQCDPTQLSIYYQGCCNEGKQVLLYQPTISGLFPMCTPFFIHLAQEIRINGPKTRYSRNGTHQGKFTSSKELSKIQASALLILNQNESQNAPNCLYEKIILGHSVIQVRKSRVPLAYYSISSKKSKSQQKQKQSPCVWFDYLRFFGFGLNPCFGTHTNSLAF